jgi:hypothetical protein
MAWISHVKTTTNKRLLISESRDDSNRCTPCRGKLNQHDTYASHASPRTLLAGGPHTWQPFTRSSTAMDRATALEKKGSRHNPYHAGWSIRGSIPSFPPEPAIEAVGVKPPSIDNQLLVLPGLYHRHVIGIFNTCSWGPTHRSLTDTGGGYNHGGADFPHITLRPS